MVDLINWFKRHLPGQATIADPDGEITGFVYVSAEDQGPMATAATGLTIGRFTDDPPWIVIDHTAQSIVLAKWPGKVWKVRALRKAPQQPYSYAGYIRATAVYVEDEMPLSVLFEHNGEEIVELLNRISKLTIDEAERIVALSDEDAARIHNQIWDRWLALEDPSSTFINQDHDGTIAVGSKAPRSPVGNATSVLHSQLAARAREISGEHAFVTDGEDQYFNPKWAKTAACLQHALFAIGVDEKLLDDHERAVLRRSFDKVIKLPERRNDA
jgi:hypothetical protein